MLVYSILLPAYFVLLLIASNGMGKAPPHTENFSNYKIVLFQE